MKLKTQVAWRSRALVYPLLPLLLLLLPPLPFSRVEESSWIVFSTRRGIGGGHVRLLFVVCHGLIVFWFRICRLVKVNWYLIIKEEKKLTDTRFETRRSRALIIPSLLIFLLFLQLKPPLFPLVEVLVWWLVLEGVVMSVCCLSSVSSTGISSIYTVNL